jgi:SAM-dependent methyltransferase
LKDGPLPCDELARANQMDEPSLYRVLRALASVGVFEEMADREFGLTPMAECLRSDVPGSLRAMAILSGEDLFWRCWGDIFRCVKTGDPAVGRLHEMSLFDYLATDPGLASVFDDAMSGWSAQTAPAVLEAFDFSAIGTLVEIGGGHGRLLTSILAAHPAMRGIVFDGPEVVADALEGIEAARFQDRCEVVGGDLFDAVPEGGDAYILRHVIHDWDEPRATTILRNCRRAMRSGGRLLLVEIVIPPGNGRSLGKLLDLEMLVLAGGRERTEAEYRALLAAAGFRLERIFPTASPVSVLEGVPA